MREKTGRIRRLFASRASVFVAFAIVAMVCAAAFPAAADTPTPRLGADPQHGRIMLDGWPGGSTVHVTIDDDNNPANGTLLSGDVTMDQGSWKDFNSLGGTDMGPVLQPGRYVTASQGATTRTLHVANLVTGGVDLGSNTVTGTADPGAALSVHTWSDSGADWSVDATADGSGDWSANFTGVHTIVRGDNGAAMIDQDDNDWTEADWRVPNPCIYSSFDHIDLSDWPGGSTVHLVVDSDSDPSNGSLYSTDVVVGPEGWGSPDDEPIANLHMHAGLYVIASQGSIAKTLQLKSISATSIDTVADIVRGKTVAGARVDGWVDNKDGVPPVTADSAGNWTLRFAGTANIVVGDTGGVHVYDNDGDATQAYWQAAGLTVKPAASKIRRGRTIVLSISGKPTDLAGEWVTLSVKKPGKTAFSTVAKVVVPRVGVWKCSYPTKATTPVGAYTFRVVYAGGWRNMPGCSATVKVTVTK
jgi:hypothetical protein